MIRFGVVQLDEEIVYNNNQCKLKINSGEYSRGTLLMTSRFVVMVCSSLCELDFRFHFSDICWKRQDSENGFMIPWDKVTVQAITQEPQRLIYFMIDASWPEDPATNQNGNGNHVEDNAEPADDGSEDEGNNSDCSLQEFTEFHISPDNLDDVDEIYFVMTKFPAVAPMDDSDDDDFFDGENIEQMNINEEDESHCVSFNLERVHLSTFHCIWR
jgi:Regulator of volume decrease after cellular swelling